MTTEEDRAPSSDFSFTDPNGNTLRLTVANEDGMPMVFAEIEPMAHAQRGVPSVLLSTDAIAELEMWLTLHRWESH